jgi:hypothetical protein
MEATTTIPPETREIFALLGREIEHLDTRIKEIEVKVIVIHKATRSAGC